MRKPLLSLAGVALVAARAASSTSASCAQRRTSHPTPRRHQPTAAAAGRTRSDALWRGDLRGPGRQSVRRPRRGPRLHLRASTSTPRRTGSPSATSPTATGPDPASVRVEEWVNAFDQGYRAPATTTFAIVVDGGPTPFTEPDEVLVRIGLQARDVRDRAREDASLTFVIDTSGSMEREDRLELVKDALRDPRRRARPRRLASRSSRSASDARVVLPVDAGATDDATDPATRSTSSEPDGSTNLEAGLRLGYEQARGTLTENGIDRVVLASDGVANVGLTDADGDPARHPRGRRGRHRAGQRRRRHGQLQRRPARAAGRPGRRLLRLRQRHRRGPTLFRDDLTSTLQTVALDAQGPGRVRSRRAVAAYRLVGYENRDIAGRRLHRSAAWTPARSAPATR